MIAGKAQRFADAFAVGISDATLTTSATALDFAWATATITGTYVDTDLEQVIFYGTLPSNIAGDVKELGLISFNSDFIQSGLPNSLVYSFTVDENWFSDATFSITNESSIGTENYKIDDATVNQYLAKGVSSINMSRYDTIKFKINSTAIGQVTLVLKNDDSNYASKDFTLADGENLMASTISAFTTTGSFNPQAVNEIRFIVKTVTNSTNSIEFDALTVSSDLNGGLVARAVLVTPIYKRTGAGMEIEYAVAL